VRGFGGERVLVSRSSRCLREATADELLSALEPRRRSSWPRRSRRACTGADPEACILTGAHARSHLSLLGTRADESYGDERLLSLRRCRRSLCHGRVRSLRARGGGRISDVALTQAHRNDVRAQGLVAHRGALPELFGSCVEALGQWRQMVGRPTPNSAICATVGRACRRCQSRRTSASRARSGAGRAWGFRPRRAPERGPPRARRSCALT
jgi:hypothetical protein